VSTNEQRRRDRVLVVDDSPETLSFLTDALEAANITALIATSGEAALALVQQITPDLVLMDANMPGMDGFEATRRLRHDFATWHLPIIFMTGLTETEHVVQGLGAGAIDYIAKPIVLDELLARVRVHLANARIAQGARSALDATGRSLFAIDEDGHVLWSTPQAGKLLGELFTSDKHRQALLTPSLIGKLTKLRVDPRHATSNFTVDFATHRVTFTYLSRIGPNEFLYRLTEDQPGASESVLRRVFGLTGRESEVLVWIAAGKSNRDISEILGISPRTVNKHLEQIFEKLGVENRATAAAMAVTAIAEQK
jgi:DNA-binding response OmpR family regulator/DNA-binding CsgD family transcriptional regulator